MKAIFLLPILIILLSFSVFSQPIQNEKSEQINDSVFYNATNKWFSAWKLISKEIYGIDNFKPVEFVLFDEKYVYTTSNISVPGGDIIKGSNVLNSRYIWKRAIHNGSLTLPDKTIVSVGLMSFASAIEGTNKSFFVMPLPSFWKTSGIESNEIGLDNLITGVFIHEFSHSQQMQNFGMQMTEYEKLNDFGTDFNDDIIQNLFGKEFTYTQLYNQEVSSFYQAIAETSKKSKVNKIKEGLDLLQQRHNKFFIEKYSALKQIDVFFLTMEGLGQYSMYLWLTNPKGGNLSQKIAIEGVRRNKKWWSQDEGFALFLILEKFSKPQKWAKRMFGNKTESVIKLINQQIK